MVVRRQSVRRMLLELEAVAQELQKYHGVSEESLERELSLRWTVERGLLAGLTLIFNMADHILAGAFRRYPESYEDSLRELAACGVITDDLRQKMAGAGGFRNILVHEYVEVELHEVAMAAREAPELYRTFSAEVKRWLETKTGDRR